MEINNLKVLMRYIALVVLSKYLNPCTTIPNPGSDIGNKIPQHTTQTNSKIHKRSPKDTILIHGYGLEFPGKKGILRRHLL